MSDLFRLGYQRIFKVNLLFSTADITVFRLSFRWKGFFLKFHRLSQQILHVPEAVFLTLDQNLISPAFVKTFSSNSLSSKLYSVLCP